MGEGSHEKRKKEWRQPLGAKPVSADSQQGNGLQSYNRRGLNSADILDKLQSRFIFRAPLKNTAPQTPWYQACETLRSRPRYALLYLDFWPCEIINLCGYKLLSIWWLVTVAIKKNLKIQSVRTLTTEVNQPLWPKFASPLLWLLPAVQNRLEVSVGQESGPVLTLGKVHAALGRTQGKVRKSSPAQHTL